MATMETALGPNTSAMASERAKWGVEQERILLESYVELRNNPAYKSDKGIKAKGWTLLVSQLNPKFGASLDKSQYKSKVDRVMKDYDIVKIAVGLSGQGVDPVTKTVTMHDDVWTKLYADKPKTVVKKLMAFRKEGFEHYAICSLIAGDSRATGEDATDLSALVATIPRAAVGSDKENQNTNLPEQEQADAQTPSVQPKKPHVVVPASDSKRKSKVKRIRGGAAGRQQKKARGDVDPKTKMMDTVSAYFSLKLAEAQQKMKKKGASEVVAVDDDGDSSSDDDDTARKEAEEEKEREEYHTNDFGIDYTDESR